MQVSGTPNKFEIFQEFYFEVNGVRISYSEALRLFSQMDADTAEEFEQYYQDETGYEIVVPGGYNLKPDSGNPTENGTKKKKKKERQADGSIKWVKKEVKNWTFTRTETITNEDGTTTTVEVPFVSKVVQNAINTKYTLEAYAKENGLMLDPQWAIYSAEEILQMVDNGVNVPQEVIDIANTIMQSNAATEQSVEGEDNQEDTTLSFLEAIPVAEKKIEKCNENNEKIEKEVKDLLPEREKRKRRLDEQMREQRRSLKEYEAFVREWNHIQTKINNGEALSTSEARRYADLMGMFEDKKSGNNKGFSLDKREIAKSMNDLNILAILGEKLADETIEIGDTLADYTSKANYKTTRTQASGEIGFLRAIVAMAQGKTLAKEATKIGNETKEYTEETQHSVNDIAQILDIEDMVTGKDEVLGAEQPKEEVVGSDDAVDEANSQPTNSTDSAQGEDKNPEITAQEDFVINDDNVKGLIKEAFDINVDLGKQTISAVKSFKVAKNDRKFAKIAGVKITKLVNEFKAQEEKRQARIQEMEQENREANEELENLTGKTSEELDAEQPTEKSEETEQPKDQTDNEKVEELRQKIASNNEEIASLKVESEEAKDKFANATTKESEILAETIPAETEALEKDTKYKEEILPAAKERLDFTDASGETLSKIGVYRIEFGMMQIMAWQWEKGLKNIALGTISTGIGLTAQIVGDSPLPTIAEKATDKAVKEEGGAINDLTTLEAQIISVTGAEETETPAQEDGENQDGETTAPTTTENATEAPVAETPTTTTATAPAQPAPATPVATTASTSAPTTSTPTTKAPQGGLRGMIAANQAEKDKIKALANSGEKTTPTTSSKTSKSEEKEISTDQANDNVSKAEEIGKEDGKDSEQVLADTEKDEKQLEKETKKLVKKMKKDQKQIEKMTKESQKAAKRQTEILAEYEAITAENEALVAEDEAKKQTQQAVGGAQGQDGEQGGTPATNSFAMGGQQSDNADKLNENDQKITTLSAEFKICERKITRNTTKIKKLQKSTKKTQKKFNKKTKIRNEKIKEAEKKEQEKQKRLAKQLAAVGIANNVFSITMSTGTLLMLSPWTHAVGQVMFNIGLKGTIFCALTTAIINVANGNLTAALIGLGTTAVQIASNFVPGAGAAASGVLGAVSAGLSVVSSSAELVNNVRAVQGKEANGVFSKIATVAGVASSVTSAASGLSNLGKTTSTFGKTLTIASTVGTALSSTSQLMTEFGWGNEKTANLLGAIGGGISLAASAIQIGQALKSESNKADNKGNDDQNTNDTDNTQSQNTSETKIKNGELVGPDGKKVDLPQGCKIEGDKVVDANGNEVKVNADGTIKKEDTNTNKSGKDTNKKDSKDPKDTKGTKNTKGTDDKSTTTVQNGKLIGPDGKEVKLPEGCRIEGTKVVDSTGAEVKINPTGEIVQTTYAEGSSVQNGKIYDKNGKEVKLPQGYKVVGNQVMGPNGKFVRLDGNGNIVKADHQQQIADAKAAKEEQKNLAKGTTDKNKKQEILNGSSEKYADKADADLQLQLENGDNTNSLAIQDELNKREQYRNQMAFLDGVNKAKQERLGQIFDMVGQAAGTVAQVAGMFASTEQEGEVKKKAAAPGKLTKRTKDIMKKNELYRRRRVQRLARAQRYYA